MEGATLRGSRGSDARVQRPRAAKHADALKVRDKKIGELAKALRDNNIKLPPRKTAGAATKTKDKSTDKADGAAGP